MEKFKAWVLYQNAKVCNVYKEQDLASMHFAVDSMKDEDTFTIKCRMMDEKQYQMLRCICGVEIFDTQEK